MTTLSIAVSRGLSVVKSLQLGVNFGQPLLMRLDDSFHLVRREQRHHIA